MINSRANKVKSSKTIMFIENHYRRDGKNRNNTKNIWSKLGKCGINSREGLPNSRRTGGLRGKQKKHRRKKNRIRRRIGSRKRLLARIYQSNFVNKLKKGDLKHSKEQQSWSRLWKSNKWPQ